VVAAAVLWSLCVLTGMAIMANEEFTPAPAKTLAAHFPRDSKIALAPDEPTLLLFLHPHCPCSEATLRELQKLKTCTPGKFALRIIFPLPPGTEPGWEKGGLLSESRAIPGANVVLDENGAAARQFGVVASGHALLYSPAGDLLFSGGITPSRGQEGDNPGEDAVADLLRLGRSDITRTPVFGCTLL